MDDSQSPSEIMSSWCMCEWRVGGVGGGWEWVSEASVIVFSILRWFCDAIFWCFTNAPGVSLYITKGGVLHAYHLKERALSSEGAFEAMSSIIPSYYCLDSWMENNCPGYSRVTAYSFCAVLHRAWSYPSAYRYSLVWSSTPEWLMLQTANQGWWHVVLPLPRPNCW